MEAAIYSTSRQVAEAVLVDGHQRNKLRAYARERFSIPKEDAEDLLQETAVELLRQRLQIENPEGFVFAVFRARCCRFLERDRKANQVFAHEPDGCDLAPAPGTSDGLDRQVALKEALNVVSASCRRILASYYTEGKSLVETAREMARATSGIGKTFNRCLRYLRRCLS